MANSTETVIDFSSHITERTRDFTGREWVFQAINDWLAHSEGPRFFLLTGEPGSGKSAIAARLVQFSEGAVSPTDGLPRLSKCFLSGVHFCWAADRRWIDPHVFAESVALQLAARHPAYAEALAEKSGDLQIHIEVSLRVQDMAGGQMAGVVINKLDVSGVSPEDAFIRVVREPLEALLREEPDLRIVLLADALDEALVHSGKVSIVDLIAQADYLPPGVRWIVTSRPVTEVVRPLRRSRLGLEERSLTEGAGLARSLDDVNRHVLSNFIERQELAGRLAADLSPAAFAATVRDKSEGNFLYVRYLLEMLVIRQGKIDQESLDELPVGLEGIYLAFLERLVQGDREAWRERYAPVLGTLAVAQQPLTEEQLASFVGTNRGRVRDVLTSLRQLLDANESLPASQRTHTLYHRTFAEFLLDEDRAEEYWCEKQEQHQRIIDHYRGKAPHWEAVDWHQVDDYGLMHLAGHLYALSDQAPFRSEFYQLICKPFMQEKLIRTSSHSAFAKDVALAIAVATPDASPPGIVELIRGCLIYATLGSLATHVPPEVLGTLALVGQTSRACSYAALILDTNRQSAAFRLIGEALLIRVLPVGVRDM